MFEHGVIITYNHLNYNNINIFTIGSDNTKYSKLVIFCNSNSIFQLVTSCICMVMSCQYSIDIILVENRTKYISCFLIVPITPCRIK